MKISQQENTDNENFSSIFGQKIFKGKGLTFLAECTQCTHRLFG